VPFSVLEELLGQLIQSSINTNIEQQYAEVKPKFSGGIEFFAGGG
jgi:hypothetical protein